MIRQVTFGFLISMMSSCLKLVLIINLGLSAWLSELMVQIQVAGGFQLVGCYGML